MKRMLAACPCDDQLSIMETDDISSLPDNAFLGNVDFYHPLSDAVSRRIRSESLTASDTIDGLHAKNSSLMMQEIFADSLDVKDLDAKGDVLILRCTTSQVWPAFYLHIARRTDASFRVWWYKKIVYMKDTQDSKECLRILRWIWNASPTWTGRFVLRKPLRRGMKSMHDGCLDLSDFLQGGSYHLHACSAAMYRVFYDCQWKRKKRAAVVSGTFSWNSSWYEWAHFLVWKQLPFIPRLYFFRRKLRMTICITTEGKIVILFCL